MTREGRGRFWKRSILGGAFALQREPDDWLQIDEMSNTSQAGCISCYVEPSGSPTWTDYRELLSEIREPAPMTSSWREADAVRRLAGKSSTARFDEIVRKELADGSRIYVARERATDAFWLFQRNAGTRTLKDCVRVSASDLDRFVAAVDRVCRDFEQLSELDAEPL